MSISNLQEKFFQKGCVTVLMIGLAGLMVLSSFSSCGRGDTGVNAVDAKADTVAIVAGMPLSATKIDNLAQASVREQLARFAPPGSPPPDVIPPFFELSAYGSAINQEMEQAYVFGIASKRNVNLKDDAAIRNAMLAAYEQQISGFRLQLMMQGTLKPNATDKDFEDAVKKQTNRSLAEIREQNIQQINTALKDPVLRAQALPQIADTLVREAIRKSISATDAEVKASYDKYDFKKILIRTPNGPGIDPKQRLQGILAEIKGGLSFEKAIDRYSQDRKEPNKRLSESVLSLTVSSMQINAEYRPLIGLKNGETSDILSTPEGAAIYKVVKVTNELPKDFEAKKKSYTDQFVASKATQIFTTEKEAVKGTIKVQWTNPVWEALYRFGTLSSSPVAAGDTNRESVVREIIAAADKGLKSTEPANARIASLLKYVAFDTLYSQAKDKAPLRAERIAVTEEFLSTTENPDLRLELASLYADEKKGEDAAEQLITAAQSNAAFDMSGQRRFGSIAAKLIEFQGKKLVTADQAKRVQEAQDTWKSSKILHDKEMAEMKIQEAADAKSAAEELAKDKAEAEKAEAKAPAPKSKTGGN